MKELFMKNYLPKNHLTIKQRRDMFRFNTDTCLLGEFLKCHSNDSVLDVGTNNGALLVYVSLHHPKFLCGIDVFEEALVLCKENLDDNGIDNYELYKCKVQDFKHDPFDVIVCNPPYFNTQENSKQINENEYLRTARHEQDLTMEVLLQNISRLLKDNGTLYLVHRANRIDDIIRLCDKYHLGITKIQLAYDENNEEAGQILVEATKNLCHNIRIAKPIFIKR